MNILLYVIVILMLLTTMSYARWESFLAVMGLQRGFVHYMGSTEQAAINSNAATWYHTIVVRDKAATQPKKGEASKPGGRLSFHLFLKESDREKYHAEYQKTRALAKQLMTSLYGEKRFFVEMAAKRPNFLDDILNEIEHASSNLESNKSIKETAGLLNLEFVDPDLHHTFYLMMRGIPTEKKVEEDTKPSSFIEEESTLDTDEEEDHAIESKESHASLGYLSLMDFITVRPNSNKVRIFLAPRPVLNAIYDDPHLVDGIIEKRLSFYRELNRFRKDHKDESERKTHKDELSKRFSDEFSQLGHAPEYKDLLDFSVSGTLPQD
ncbi:MAG: hypothetical protein H0X51_09055 [Parachlamydiaceae bacterium]|nr:hypothetical protein [Parachlamydiaceae bacterium]